MINIYQRKYLITTNGRPWIPLSDRLYRITWRKFLGRGRPQEVIWAHEVDSIIHLGLNI